MFYSRLLSLCSEREIKITNVISELKLSSGNLSKWKAGGAPKGDTLCKIADYFDVSTDYLLGRDEKVTHPENHAVFLERVIDLIQSQGITKNKLLVDLNLNKSSFFDWERRNTIPGGEIVAKIADYFGVSTDYLLGRTDEKVQPPADDGERLDRNIITIAGRDESIHEYVVSDEQKELVRQMLDNFKPVEEGRT